MASWSIWKGIGPQKLQPHALSHHHIPAWKQASSSFPEGRPHLPPFQEAVSPASKLTLKLDLHTVAARLIPSPVGNTSSVNKGT